MAARGMRGRTYSIGVLLVEMGNPFLPEVIAGISEICGAEGYKVLIGIGQGQLTLEESLLHTMIDHGMDGLILVAPHMAGDRLESYARQIPLVVMAHHDETARAYDTVNSDDFAGATVAVQALIDQGISDIAMLSLHVEDDSAHTNVSTMRELGYRHAMAAAGLNNHIRILPIANDKQTSIGQISVILSAPNRPQAIFCWSDLIAIDLIGMAKAAGITVPGDLAVIGYDNSPPAALPLIDLSSVDQNARALGGAAASALLMRIQGRTKSVQQTIQPSLALRSSHRNMNGT
jgi:LacI family transcriptional regulator